MLYKLIPLSAALQGREYVIDHITKGKSYANHLRGYGIFPDSRITPLFSSPANNPSAYEIMGTVLALRREDSDNIYVSPAPDQVYI